LAKPYEEKRTAFKKARPKQLAQRRRRRRRRRKGSGRNQQAATEDPCKDRISNIHRRNDR
jgi:hypothetical protein